MIAKFKRLNKSKNEARALLEGARERKRVAKRKTKKSKVAQRIAEEKINMYKQVLVLL